MRINKTLIDGTPRRGEVWINGWGIFYSGLYGIETPRGRSLYGPSPFMRQRCRKAAQRRAS